MIHDDIALSAAHCESVNSPFDTRVFVNGIETKKGIFRTIERQLAHPLYDANGAASSDYDYLLLKLHKSALVDENGDATGAETVQLNRNPAVPVTGDNLMAVGFGLTAEGGSRTSEVLNDVQVQYVAEEVCLDQYGVNTFVPDLMFCAGVEDGGKDTCQVRARQQFSFCFCLRYSFSQRSPKRHGDVACLLDFHRATAEVRSFSTGSKLVLSRTVLDAPAKITTVSILAYRPSLNGLTT